MTLNLMLTSEYAVYLSGDFRLTYKTGSITDDYNTQKLIPVFKFGWGALVSFAGIAKTSNGLDVGDWIAKQLHSIPMKAKVSTLNKVLMEANSWVSRISPHQPFILSIVGFSGTRPFATVLSNFCTKDGLPAQNVSPNLISFSYKPKIADARPVGDVAAVKQSEIEELKKMLVENRSPIDIQNAIAQINAIASTRTSSISPECITGHLLPTGKAEIITHGINENTTYFPSFVARDFLSKGINGFVLKTDDAGIPLPLIWAGMTATITKIPNHGNFVATVHRIRNAEKPIAGKPPNNSQVFWKIAEPNEPKRVILNLEKSKH